jgi:hypothetical protein
MLSYDMMALYSKVDHGQRLSNREMSQLISYYQMVIDNAQNNGEAFLPYVISCMGWAFELSSALSNARENGGDFEAVALASPRPSSSYSYPFDDWPIMQNIFVAAYAEWTKLGKISRDEIRRSLKKN